MGILDDAIREHLELKRQHGAEVEDVERLEQEAFGPAARPGDPDFAEPSTGTGEQAVSETGEWSGVTSGEQPSAEAASVDAPASEPPSEEVVAEAAEVSEPPSEELPAAAESGAPAEEASSGGFGVFDAEAEFGAGAEEIPADASPAERARIEHADLDDTVDHPAPVQLGPEDEAEPDPSAAAPAEPEAADATEPVESKPEAADADVTERVEREPEPGAAAEPAAPEAPEPAAPEAPEKDIFAGEDFGLEEIDLSIEDEPESGEQRAADKGEDDEGDDLLEETPDFLQETEGEDLWFEQGPPRDFDFDDD